MAGRRSTASKLGPVLGAGLVVITAAYAHVTVRPRESRPGATETYTMRVPSERGLGSVRVEAEFPAAVEIRTLHEKPGWKVDPKKDASGKIVGATWSGSRIAPGEAVEFTFEARNPVEETSLTWKAVQVYEDDSRVEWTGPRGSRTPASVTVIKKPAADQ